MAEKYYFKETKGKNDWGPLPRWFQAGDEVTHFTGHTYGLDREDLMYLGVETIPCTCEGWGGFFTVPVSMLVDKDGKSPMGAYQRFEK